MGTLRAKRAGLEHKRIYDIRHTHASRLMSKGMNPKLVQDRLGHGSIEVPLGIYSHVQPEDLELTLHEKAPHVK